MESRFGGCRLCVVGLLCLNLFPLFGTGALGWGVNELIVLYWIEWFVVIAVGAVRAWPARLVTYPIPEQRREPSVRVRRGTLDIAGRSVLARNVPSIVAQLLGFLAFWTVTGAALLWSASPLSHPWWELHAGVVVTAGLLALGHGLLARAYFRTNQFERESPESAAAASSAYTVGILVLVGLVVSVSLSGSASDPAPLAVLYAIVGGKLALVALVHTRRWRWFRRTTETPIEYEQAFFAGLSRQGGLTEIGAVPSVPHPGATPQTTVRPSISSIVAASPFRGLLGIHASLSVFVSTGFALLFVVDGRPIASTGSLTVGFLLVTLPALIVSLPRHGSLEYECYDDQLVCYDRWLGEPVWQLPYDTIESVSVDRGFAARIAGYGTVRVETLDDRLAELAYLREYRGVADAIQRRATLPAGG
ncbi:hypothetical protein Halru_3110 [Halovivax ruber XH-70]|uniref:YdbS-like PH domain-containing protein n=1 Tax=Halovivax ruber (strain DSM 18193 / JCM 13892 / XH-70) TaxID=797302 RepID=L0IHF8_HALRX|nr:PH domain-containing protein [Halovivax ruber]AGB17676.1 hypothetical protein Halru_3110 [Halovivax ruber XH-70]